jgi:hypothetical protein
VVVETHAEKVARLRLEVARSRSLEDYRKRVISTARKGKRGLFVRAVLDVCNDLVQNRAWDCR